MIHINNTRDLLIYKGPGGRWQYGHRREVAIADVAKIIIVYDVGVDA